MSSGETPKQPSSDGIEKRSKSEELEQREAKRPRSSLALPTAPEESYYDPPTILEIAASAVQKVGLHVENENEEVVMYCREKVKALFRFLQDVLRKRRKIGPGNNPYKLPWIIGPPGVGKSLAVFAFMQSPPVSEWAITWIRSGRGELFHCCHRYQTVEEYTTFTSYQSGQYLAGLSVKNQHILVLDGYTKTSATMLGYSQVWLQEDFEKRRLFVVCSMASRGKSTYDRDMTLNVEEYPVCSWTLEEYKAAVEEPKVYDSVKEKLGTDTDKSRDELVESKYYFAGGNARFMFQKDTDTVKVALDEAIKRVPDIQTFVAGSIGLSSTALVHQLISMQDGMPGIVSQFAGNRLAVKLGTALVEHFTRVYESKLNQSMKEFLFEMWFFAKSSGEGLSYDLIDCGPGKTWAKSNLVYLPSKEERLVRESPTWFQPAWNNGGFVYVDPQKKTVRFVQIMLNNHHSFKIHFFYKFLNRLRNYMHTETLEIFFVYPKGTVPQKPETTGQGLLTEFQWKNGEEWEKVTKVRLDWPG